MEKNIKNQVKQPTKDFYGIRSYKSKLCEAQNSKKASNGKHSYHLSLPVSFKLEFINNNMNSNSDPNLYKFGITKKALLKNIPGIALIPLLLIKAKQGK